MKNDRFDGRFFIINTNKKKKVSSTFFVCDSPGARTQDPILKRDVLYLLS